MADDRDLEALVLPHDNLQFTDIPGLSPHIGNPDVAKSEFTKVPAITTPPSSLRPSLSQTSYPGTGPPIQAPSTCSNASRNVNHTSAFPEPQNVTIGIELGVIINGLSAKDSPQRHNLVAAALDPLAKALNTTVSCQQDTHITDTHLHNRVFRVVCHPSIVPATMQVTDNTSSRIKIAAGVQVTTPMLIYKGWALTVPLTMKLIGESFNISYNPSTSLHVHVGIGRPYTLRDLKRIAKAIILFQDTINDLHPIYKGNIYRPFGSCILPGNGSKYPREINDYNVMLVLNNAKSIPELLYMINPMHNLVQEHAISSRWKYYRFSFENVLTLGTIEFRQAEGSIDASAAVYWIKRLIKFVISAVSTPDDVIEKLAMEGVGKTKSTFILRAFGLAPVMDEFPNDVNVDEAYRYLLARYKKV